MHPAVAQSPSTSPSAEQHLDGYPSAKDRSADRTRFLRWAYQDAGALAQDIGTRVPLYVLAGGVLASGAQLDASLQQDAEALYGRAPVVAEALDAANLLGERHVTLPAAGIFALTLATDDTRLQDAAFTSLQSLIYSRIITDALKSAVGRARPEAGAGAYQTDPFSEHTSFPSGHATTAFAVVTPWVLYYPSAATYGLFALSAGTAAARVALDKHWPTDVVAGAAVGFFTARYLVQRHKQATHASRLQVTPLWGAGTVGISLRLQLD